MKKEGWPDFPFSHWQAKKWNMSSLRAIASHLEEKTTPRRQRSSSGYRGEATDMEKQIFQHIEDLEQQVFELEDAVQALLQIIDDNRPSQRAKRSLRWTREKTSKYWHKLEENTLYKILAAVGVVATLWLVINFVIRHLHTWRK